ncbi:MAG: hypothetical protein RBG13Loki_2604 [Promethearchaeota archaeon CR_4]|nr:MAG: hypothetical protein RBG13Loki_2604 [Candidatus Lokiarchaeota archaeon CR_4]
MIPPCLLGNESRGVLLKCMAIVPSFLKDFKNEIVRLNIKIHSITPRFSVIPIEMGFLIEAEKTSTLYEVILKIFNVNVYQGFKIEGFGLWNVDILKHPKNADPHLLLRSAHYICGKIGCLKNTHENIWK